MPCPGTWRPHRGRSHRRVARAPCQIADYFLSCCHGEKLCGSGTCPGWCCSDDSSPWRCLSNWPLGWWGCAAAGRSRREQSRASDRRTGSDTDLGSYLGEDVDLDGLRALAGRVGGPTA